MGPGDALATIAESQLGVRSDAWSDRGRLFGYLMASDSSLADFGTRKNGVTELRWTRPGFGTPSALHATHRYSLMPELHAAASPPAMLRIHNWCAAFVDWCVLELLMKQGNLTTLSLAHRPGTASATGLLDWGRRRGCNVFEGGKLAPQRGDIAVYTFHTRHGDQHHVGIVSECEANSSRLSTVEGNTSQSGHGNQGYAVAKRPRDKSLLKGLVRLPASR